MTVPRIHHLRAIRAALLITAMAVAAACSEETPTGVSRSDLQGLWTGDFNGTVLMGRTLSGSVDWTFNATTFQIVFFDQPVDQAERISGTWKFSEGRLVFVLTSSFPIGDDIGATDTLNVSILGNELSMRTQGGSDILLRLSARTTVLESPPPADGHLAFTVFNTRRHASRCVSLAHSPPVLTYNPACTNLFRGELVRKYPLRS